MATTVARRTTARPALRARCDGCLAHIRRLGEMVSTACRWLWGTIRALDALDDDLERDLLDDEQAAGSLLVESTLAAMADRRISQAERARTLVLAERWRRRGQRLRAYNEREDQQLEEARQSASYARQTLAPASQALNYAEEQASPCHGGCETPWADVRI